LAFNGVISLQKDQHNLNFYLNALKNHRKDLKNKVNHLPIFLLSHRKRKQKQTDTFDI